VLNNQKLTTSLAQKGEKQEEIVIQAVPLAVLLLIKALGRALVKILATTCLKRDQMESKAGEWGALISINWSIKVRSMGKRRKST
jgi:hypothetical protein